MSKGKSQDGVEGRQMPRQTRINRARGRMGSKSKEGEPVEELGWAATAKESTSVN